MKKAERNFLHLMEDILESINKIRRYTKTMDYEKFSRDEKTVDAVIRNLEIIGEASNKLPQFIKDKYPRTPWDEMYRMRNKAIHEYFGVDHQIIWSIIKDHLPTNYTDIREAYRIEGGENI